MEVQFFDLRWPDPTCVEVQVHNSDRLGRKQFRFGDSFSFEIKDETTKCVGSMIDNVWHPCQYQTIGYARCKPCKSREGTFIYTMFDGFNTDMFNQDDMAKIAGPHVVYLALFEDSIMKVGVSGLGRKELRQVEQGSFSTLYIAQTEDGTQARQIETLIRKSGIQDKIRSSQKKDLVITTITPEEAEKQLQELYASCKSTLDEYPKLKTLLLEKPEYKNWETTYATDALKTKDQRLHSVKLQEGDAISGTLVAARGPFLVIDTGEEHLSICMKDYIGKTLLFEAKAPGLYTKKAFQNSLF